MIRTDTLQTLAQHLDFEFDPAVCQVAGSVPYSSRYHTTTISEVGDTRYAQFRIDPYTRQLYGREPVDGVVSEGLNGEAEQANEAPVDPDKEHDTSLHGLVEQREGHIAFYTSYKAPDSLYEFKTVNAPGGANKMHALLGRTPGEDMPTFEARSTSQTPEGVFTAGQITEAIADMTMLAPDVHDFSFTEHDLGFAFAGHGPSWPNTAPVIYRHLSRVAEDTIKQHGTRIHEEKANRPAEVATIAKALDSLIHYQKPSSDSLAVMELRVRDGRYDTVSDADIANDLLQQAFVRVCQSQGYLAANLLAVPPDATESERSRHGYWIGMQQVAGVVDTRLVLHEVRPHPEATNRQTLRALNVLSIFKAELERRFAYNKDHLLVA